ncbi:caspase-3-like [Pseudophryne corroboree]|uniref:caspase-3-like n=1 Tax=Pseudophryne corroboree TaxID=495146 RepID=UPI0030814BCB
MEEQLGNMWNETDSKNVNGGYQRYYKMDYPEKSVCLILNMEHFDIPGVIRRAGTHTDKKTLKNTFKKLGFQVRIEENLSCTEIENVLQKVTAEDHSQRSCFVCAVLSHGTEDGIFSRDHIFTLNWLVTFFDKNNCKSLAGKPKLFFIQACRGAEYDFGIETDSGSEDRSSAPQLPKEADFLYAYSTPLGYFAWRNSEYGSWFIQSLCKMLQEHGSKLELMQILTRVNHKVALEYESSIGGKEIPCFVSMLTKELYLTPQST